MAAILHYLLALAATGIILADVYTHAGSTATPLTLTELITSAGWLALAWGSVCLHVYASGILLMLRQPNRR
jgi:hypothetical protein